MKTTDRPAGQPLFVQEVTGELEPGYWVPQCLAEWLEVQRTTVFWGAWGQQQQEERNLRRMLGIWVFILMSAQVAAVFGFILLDAAKVVTLNTTVVQLVLPCVLGEVFGMGYLVVKYLFGPHAAAPPTRHKGR